MASMGDYTVTEMGHQGHRRLGSNRSMERQASDLLGRTLRPQRQEPLTFGKCKNRSNVT